MVLGWKKYLTEVFVDQCKIAWEQQNSLLRELEMGVSRGEESVIQVLYPNPTDYTGIHFQGIHVLILLCQVWHPECDRKLKAEAQWDFLRGVIRGDAELYPLQKPVQNSLLENLLLQQLQVLVGSFPSSSPHFPWRSFPRNCPDWVRIVSVSCRRSFQNLILASGTDNEFILWLYAYFASHILASTPELFSEPWSYSCLEAIVLDKCISLILGNERENLQALITAQPFLDQRTTLT